MGSNDRRRTLLKILEATFEGAPVTVEKLSQMVNSSVRTVRYDLDNLESDLADKGIILHKKARHGIWLEYLNDKNTYNKSLNYYIYDPKERRDRIIVSLLEKENNSIDKLADDLMVSRNTLLSDLKDVQEFLNSRGLSYNSKRGFGIWASGDELSIRDVLTHVFNKGEFEFNHYDDIPKAQNHLEKQKPFREYVSDIPVQRLADVFLEIIKNFDLSYSDTSINRMIISLCVQVKRINSNHSMVYDEEISIPFNPIIKSVAYSISQGLQEFVKIDISDGEQFYILNQLLHSKIYPMQMETKEEFDKLNNTSVEMAKKFVEIVQMLLGDMYIDDEELLYNLAVHLRPAVERAAYGIKMTNPLLGQIQGKYGELFKIAKKAADKLTQQYGLQFSEDEIGYLTIHLGAAVERRKMRQDKTLSVVLICGNGVGTANLLAVTLRNRVSYLKIISTVSFYKFNLAEAEKADIIISTVPITIPNKAVLRVSAIMTEAELKVVEKQIQYFYNKKFDNRQLPIETPLEAIRLSDVIDENMVLLDVGADDWEEAIRISGSLLVASDAVTEQYVDKMVECVKKFGTYAVIRPGIAMPHSRFEDGSKRIAVGFVRLNKPVKFGLGDSVTDVDMIFPFSAIDEKSHLGVIEDLWNVFTNDDKIAEIRKCKSKKEFLDIISL